MPKTELVFTSRYRRRSFTPLPAHSDARPSIKIDDRGQETCWCGHIRSHHQGGGCSYCRSAQHYEPHWYGEPIPQLNALSTSVHPQSVNRLEVQKKNAIFNLKNIIELGIWLAYGMVLISVAVITISAILIITVPFFWGWLAPPAAASLIISAVKERQASKKKWIRLAGGMILGMFSLWFWFYMPN